MKPKDVKTLLCCGDRQYEPCKRWDKAGDYDECYKCLHLYGIREGGVEDYHTSSPTYRQVLKRDRIKPMKVKETLQLQINQLMYDNAVMQQQLDYIEDMLNKVAPELEQMLYQRRQKEMYKLQEKERRKLEEMMNARRIKEKRKEWKLINSKANNFFDKL